MEDNQHNDTLTVDLLRLIQNTNPSASLGFPTTEEMNRFRQRRHDRERFGSERRREDRDRRFQLLKTAALANLRKDRP